MTRDGLLPAPRHRALRLAVVCAAACLVCASPPSPGGPSAWTRSPAAFPTRLASAGSAACPALATPLLAIFGGEQDGEDPINTLFTLTPAPAGSDAPPTVQELVISSVSNGTHTFPPSALPPYADHAVACLGQHLYSFGGTVGDSEPLGIAASKRSNAMWQYSFETGVWTVFRPPVAPAIRKDAFLAGIESLGVLAMHAGSGSEADPTDFWTFSPETGEWTEVFPTVEAALVDFLPRQDTGSTVFGDSMILFGGDTLDGNDNTILEWNVADNTFGRIVPADESQPLPTKREHSRIAHVVHPTTAADKLVVFSGEGDDGYLTDVQVFDWATRVWERPLPLVEPWPPAREAHVMAGFGSVAYMTNGKGDDAVFDDVWTFRVGACNVGCSDRGICNPDTLECECYPDAHGVACEIEDPEFPEMGVRHPWMDVTPKSLPYPRNLVSSSGTVCPDDGSGSFVIAGGEYNGEDAVNYVWRFDSATEEWSYLEPVSDEAAPAGFSDHAVACIGRTIYVFGGSTPEAGRTNSIFAFDMDTRVWTNPDPAGPRPSIRKDPMMGAVDSDRILLHAGSGAEANEADFWYYYPATNVWEEISPTILPAGTAVLPREDTGVVVANGRLYIFGGDVGDVLDNGMYEFDPIANTFTALDATGTPPSVREHSRIAHIVTDAGEDKLVIFGGDTENGGVDSELRVFDLATLAWETRMVQPAGLWPEARESHQIVGFGASVYVATGKYDDVLLNRLYKFTYGICPLSCSLRGTCNYPVCTCDDTAVADGDMCEVSSVAFQALSPNIDAMPRLRRGMKFGLDNDLFYATGEDRTNSVGVRAAYRYSSATNTWTFEPGMTFPSNRQYGEDVAIGRTVYAFGGLISATQAMINELWVLDPDALTWSLVTPAVGSPVPAPRQKVAIASDKTRTIFVYGGQLTFDVDLLADLWSYDTQTNVWTELIPNDAALLPGPRAEAVLEYWEGDLYLACGASPDGFQTDLWRINPNTAEAVMLADYKTTLGVPGITSPGYLLFPDEGMLLIVGGDGVSVSVDLFLVANLTSGAASQPARSPSLPNVGDPLPIFDSIALAPWATEIMVFGRSDEVPDKSMLMYTIDPQVCPGQCSGRGSCALFECTCDAQFSGPACDVFTCPIECSALHGECNPDTFLCDCLDGYSGADCTVAPVQRASSDSGDLTPVIASVAAAAALIVVFVIIFLWYRRKSLVAVEELLRAEKGWSINPDELDLQERIGIGSYGEVFRASWRGTDVAVKRLLDRKLTKTLVQDFVAEAKLMTDLRHPNIVLFMGASTVEHTHLCIVTEYLSQGSLFDLLQSNDAASLTSGIRMRMLVDIAKGLVFLHTGRPPIVHGDLKSPNILLDSSLRAKVSDFGLARLGHAELDDDAKDDETAGSLYWMSPELISGSPISAEADVYALGIVMWETFANRLPYADLIPSTIAYRVVSDNLRPEKSVILGTMPLLVSSLMEDCLRAKPDSRPTMRDVVLRLKESTQEDNALSSMASMTTGSIAVSSLLSSSTTPAPAGDVAIVFTDVERSTPLWESNPDAMFESLNVHNDVIRKAIRKHNGYEVKIEGDAFMVAFQHPIQALQFCIQAQQDLMEAKWPDEILNEPAAARMVMSGACIFCGLRVRMGIHVGPAINKVDPVTGRNDYFGVHVGRAARVSSIALGGVIFVSDSARALIPDEVMADIAAFGFVGEVKLKGVNEPMMVTWVMPKTLAKREAFYGEALTAMTQGTIAGSGTLTSRASGDAAAVDTLVRVLADDINGAFQGARTIPHAELTIMTKLGAGSYGEVFSGRWQDKTVVVKRLFRQKMDMASLMALHHEAKMLAKLQHPNVVQLHGVCMEAKHLSLVMEMASGGNLAVFLAQETAVMLPAAKQAALLAGCAQGLAFLHSQTPTVVHRDLKSANVLLTQGGGVKLCDFGLARLKTASATMTKVGSLAWMAPEVIAGKRYNEKADIYSLGVIAWEIVTRRVPWYGYPGIKISRCVIDGERLAFPKATATNPIAKIATLCWAQDPAERPTAAELCTRLAPLLDGSTDPPTDVGPQSAYLEGGGE